MTDSVDLLITGGNIVDGTGVPGRAGTVVVDGDRVRVLPPGTDLPTHAAETIDATVTAPVQQDARAFFRHRTDARQ